MLNIDGHHVQNWADIRERLEHREELAVILRIWFFGELQTTHLIIYNVKNKT